MINEESKFHLGDHVLHLGDKFIITAVNYDTYGKWTYELRKTDDLNLSKIGEATEKLGKTLLPVFQKANEEIAKTVPYPIYTKGQWVEVRRSSGKMAYGEYIGRFDETLLEIKLSGEDETTVFHSNRVAPASYTRGQEVEVKRNHYWVKALYLHKNGSHFVYIPDLLDEGTCWVSDNEIRPLQKESK